MEIISTTLAILLGIFVFVLSRNKDIILLPRVLLFPVAGSPGGDWLHDLAGQQSPWPQMLDWTWETEFSSWFC